MKNQYKLASDKIANMDVQVSDYEELRLKILGSL